MTETSAVMGGHRAANTAPNLDAVFSGRDASNVDGCAALALHEVVHEQCDAEGLHQVNASIPCNDGLKHHKTARGREPFDLLHKGV